MSVQIRRFWGKGLRELERSIRQQRGAKHLIREAKKADWVKCVESTCKRMPLRIEGHFGRK